MKGSCFKFQGAGGLSLFLQQPNVQQMQMAEQNQTGRDQQTPHKVHKTLFEGLQLTVFKSLEPTSAEAFW